MLYDEYSSHHRYNHLHDNVQQDKLKQRRCKSRERLKHLDSSIEERVHHQHLDEWEYDLKNEYLI